MQPQDALDMPYDQGIHRTYRFASPLPGDRLVHPHIKKSQVYPF